MGKTATQWYNLHAKGLIKPVTMLVKQHFDREEFQKFRLSLRWVGKLDFRPLPHTLKCIRFFSSQSVNLGGFG